MKLGKKGRLCIFVLCCLLINYFGKVIAVTAELPVWLDAVGTVFAAYVLGPVCGAMVGAASNIIYSINSQTAIYYGLTNISVGIIVGVFAKKGYLKSLFGIMSAAFAVTVLSVMVSTPLNFLLSDGAIGNVWGDGVAGLLQSYGTNSILSHIIGQFYMDFLDKTLTMLLLYCTLKLAEKRRSGKNTKKSRMNGGALSLILMFSLFTAGFSTDIVYAEEIGYSRDRYDFKKYIQTVYNSDNGLPGGMANDIVQTKDGVIWIGTYGGLYRYGGNDIEWMNDFESVKTVNCLYTDEAGRLWIGTNDNGLSICINEQISNMLNKKDGFPSNSVRCITQSSEGYYYVGTTDSLVVVTLSGGLKVYDIIPEAVYAKRICADRSGNVAAVTDEGELFLIRGTEVIGHRTIQKEGEAYCSCAFDDRGILYVGSSANTVEGFDISSGSFERLFSKECGGLTGINSLDFSYEGLCFICADNGAGYLTAENEFSPIDTNNFNSSIEHMLVDYQGNLWFASSRLGLLRMCPSVFSQVGGNEDMKEDVVNTVIKWQDVLYLGTDSGVRTAHSKLSTAESEILRSLEGVRIRCFMADSKDHLWICTSGKGLREVNPQGSIRVYDSSCGTAGDKFRSVIELTDGTVAAAGDYGITFIAEGRVIDTVDSSDGLSNPKVLSLCEGSDGSLLAGTDGNGIAVIKNGEITRTFKQEDGLSSDIILRIVPDSGGGGLFVVTGNGLCYLDDDNSIRIFENFPYYNNYDVIEGRKGELFVLSSAGIFVVDRNELMEGGEVKYLLLNSKQGLTVSLTPNSWNYADENGILYLSGDTGALCLNLNEYEIPVRSYRMHLRELVADGESCVIEKGMETVIPSGDYELLITPEVVNFSVNDPDIIVYLEGYDTEKKIIPQSKLTTLSYQNLPSGEYVLHIAVPDSRTGDIIAENTYRIVKEKAFFENLWFKLYAGIVAVITISYLTWLFIRTQLYKTMKMQRMELELAKNQLKMGNETILTIAKAVDAKDENTSQHSVRVSEYSVMIARKLGYSDDECENLRKIAILHDIGKIGIPDSVLNKPARLTDEEYAVMKSHVVRGAQILKNFTMIENVADGALYHHERYDGKGYISGLKGEEIPLNARIIGIADAFDAMTANRVYRKQLDLDFVLGELKKGRGTQFDPKLVDIMLGLIEDGTINVNEIYGKKLSEVYADDV